MHISAHKKLPPDHCLSLIDRKGREIPDPIMKLKFLSHVMEETSRLSLLYRLCPSLARGVLRTRVKGCADRVCLEKSTGAPVSTWRRRPLPRTFLHLAVLLLLLVPPGLYLFLYPSNIAFVPALSRGKNSPPANSFVFPWQSPSSGSWSGGWEPEIRRDLSLYLDRHILKVFLSQRQSEFSPVLFPDEFHIHRKPGYAEFRKPGFPEYSRIPEKALPMDSMGTETSVPPFNLPANLPMNFPLSEKPALCWSRPPPRMEGRINSSGTAPSALPVESGREKIPLVTQSKRGRANHGDPPSDVNSRPARGVDGNSDEPWENSIYQYRASAGAGAGKGSGKSGNRLHRSFSKQTGGVNENNGMPWGTSIYWNRASARSAGREYSGEPDNMLHRSLWTGIFEGGEKQWGPAHLLSYGTGGAGVAPEFPRWVGSAPTLFSAPVETSEESYPLPEVLPFCLKTSRKTSGMPGETTIAASVYLRSSPPVSPPVREDPPLSDEPVSSAGKDSKAHDPPVEKTGRKHATEARKDGAAKKFPEYLDEPIWLVEKGGDWELYSNGLRIITTHTVDNLPRCYYRFSKTDSKLPEKVQASNRIAGILYHSSESDLYPFLPEMNQSIKEHSRRLIRYVRRHRCYNYLIDRFGQVFRIVREDHAAFHAGNSLWADRESAYLNLNHAFVGICFEGRDFEKSESTKKEPLKISGDKTSTINSAQQRSGRELTDWLRVKFRIPQENCVPHGLASINPGNKLIGYHLDLSIKFPHKAFALNNKNLTPLPSITEFGFSYDKYFVGVFKGNLWPGIRASEKLIEKRAKKLKISPRKLRKRLNKRFDKLHRMKQDLQETLAENSHKSTLRASSHPLTPP